MRDEKKITKMREAAKICSAILKRLQEEVKVGVNLLDLDALAMELCNENRVKPAFYGFEGYPAAICANLNDIVVHGIPYDYELNEGDILGLDFGIRYEKVFSDVSVTLPVGKISKESANLIEVARAATLNGIKQAVPGNTVGDIGAAMQETVEKAGFSVVKEMVGHGIGYKLHEMPYIPGYGKRGQGEKLSDGQTVAIEAIIAQGGAEILIAAEDGWTAYTKDGMLSALFEHTLVVGEKPEILTSW